MSPELLVLRLVHVLGGIFWVGSGAFTAFFFAPALKQSGTNPGPLFAALGQRRLFLVLPIVALLTILSGARLMSIAAGGAATYFASSTGRTYVWSGVAAVVAFLLSLLIARPSAARGGQLAAAMASAPAAERPALAQEVARLQRRGGLASTAAISLLILAATGMAVARYL